MPTRAQMTERIAEDEEGEEGEEDKEEYDQFIDLVNTVPDGPQHAHLGEELHSDAPLHVSVAESLAAIEESQRISEEAISERNMRLLEHDKLGPVPDWVKIMFSCVLGDHFHAMDRIWVPTHHEHKKGYFYSSMEAFFQWDRDGLERVKERLIQSGWTDDEFE
jgi:hypothetical protein